MIGRLLSGALILLAALIGSQLPEFAQQYRQRLGGAVDELRLVIERFDSDARSQGLDRNQALSRHMLNPDDLFRKRGLAMQDAIARHARLTEQQNAMAQDSPASRLIVFLTAADPDLRKATFDIYEPALPVTTEGGFLATLGACLGWLLARLLGWPKRSLDRKLAARRGETFRA